jgi:hypothetical protein
MKLNKKGVIEVQFNWIYVAVVGVILLSSFITIAVNIRKNSQEKLAFDAITYLDEIFTSLQGSENTEHSITLPGLELELSNDAEVCNYYSVTSTDVGRVSTSHLPVFGPDLIKKNILSFALGWDIPFRTNYFLFLTSPDIVYVFVDANELYAEMPKHLTKQVESTAYDFRNQNYYKVKFISYSSLNNEALHTSVKKLKDKDVSGIYVDKNTKTLTFYEMNDGVLEQTGQSYYIDKATLYGAVYAENQGGYECNLRKALERLNKVSSLLIKRIDKIMAANLLPQCRNEDATYARAKDLLLDINLATESVEITNGKINELNNIKQELQSYNLNLNKKSCPTVY